MDLNPECALHIGVRLMREVNEIEDRYGPMTPLREVGMIRKDGGPGHE